MELRRAIFAAQWQLSSTEPPPHIAYSIPSAMPFAYAALIETVSVAIHAISLTSIALDDPVARVGAGMISLLTLRALVSAGHFAGKVLTIRRF